MCACSSIRRQRCEENVNLSFRFLFSSVFNHFSLNGLRKTDVFTSNQSQIEEEERTNRHAFNNVLLVPTTSMRFTLASFFFHSPEMKNFFFQKCVRDLPLPHFLSRSFSSSSSSLSFDRPTSFFFFFATNDGNSRMQM